LFLHLLPVFEEVGKIEVVIKKLVEVIRVEFGSILIVVVISLFGRLVSDIKVVLGTDVFVFVELLIGLGCDVSVVDITTIAAITTPEPTVNIT
jgi:hypothetical protein